MTLEQQVVSLELAKRLKELGVKQESVFVYIKTKHAKGIYYVTEAIKPLLSMPDTEWYAAFTVAELGEMLGTKEVQGKSHVLYWKTRDDWTAKVTCWWDGKQPHATQYTVATTLADCMAKMLIYLLENKLL
jgi:hypothetical protein